MDMNSIRISLEYFCINLLLSAIVTVVQKLYLWFNELTFVTAHIQTLPRLT